MFTVERIGISIYSRTGSEKVFTVEWIWISVYSRMDRDKCLQ